MAIVVLGIDLGKNSRSLVGLAGRGSVILRRRMRRKSVAGFVEGLPRFVVAMRRAAARITSGACSSRAVTPSRRPTLPTHGRLQRIRVVRSREL